MLVEPENSTIAIVLIGSFNPRIFNPDWFARNDLISAAEAETADITIVHSEISKFLALGNSGIFVQINDHFEVSNSDHVTGCDEIIRLLQENFEESINRAEHIVDQVMKLKDLKDA